jgi:hypothetical protein
MNRHSKKPIKEANYVTSYVLCILLSIGLIYSELNAQVNLDNWYVRSLNSPVKGFTYGNSTYAFISQTAGIATSSDGINWIARNCGLKLTYGNYLNGIAFGQNRFIAVGVRDNFSGVMTNSTNGISWSPKNLANPLFCIRFINNKFIAVGSNNILTSSDGTNWNYYSPSSSSPDLYDVTYGNGIYVAVGQAIFSGSIVASTDSSNWTTLTTVPSNPINGIVYGNGMFAAVGGGGTILTSTNGINWTARNSNTSNNLNKITYGNNRFYIVGDNFTLLTSTNGVDWTNLTSGGGNALISANFINNTYYLGGLEGYIYRSEGTVFNKRLSWIGGFLDRDDADIAYGIGIFVLAGDIMPTRIGYTVDGINWSVKGYDINRNGDGYRVCYGKDKFVITGNYQLFTSPNGNSWTEYSFPYTNIKAITYSNGLYVAVGTYGTIVTSTDLNKWEEQISGTYDDLFSISYGNGIFVAVGEKAILISPNGKTWTIISYIPFSPKNPYYSGVTFGNGLFVVTGLINDANNASYIIKSTNGVNWTTRLFSNQSIWLKSLAYGSGNFVAVGDGYIYVSPDGINWSNKLLNIMGPLDNITFGENSFIAMGSDKIYQAGLISNPIYTFHYLYLPLIRK